MPSHEDFFKRKEDQDWRKTVDHEIMSLMTGHQVLAEKLTHFEDTLQAHDDILRGDEDHDALISKVNALVNEMNKFNALLYKDSAGNPGYLKKIDMLLDDRDKEEKQEGFRWAFRTAFWPVVVVQLLVLIGLVIVNWDQIQGYIVLHEHIHQAAAIEAQTKKLQAKRKHKSPPPPPPEEESE